MIFGKAAALFISLGIYHAHIDYSKKFGGTQRLVGSLRISTDCFPGVTGFPVGYVRHSYQYINILDSQRGNNNIPSSLWAVWIETKITQPYSIVS